MNPIENPAMPLLIIFQACVVALGEDEALRLPAFAEGDDDLADHMSGMMFGIAFKHGTNDYLDLVEPQP